MILEIGRSKKCYLKSLMETLRPQSSDEDEYVENIETNENQEIENLVHAVCEEEVELVGSASDIHNVSVELATENYYDLACEILKKGLNMKKYSRNYDLLADFLKYSTYSSTHIQMAESCYEKLLKIPVKRWKWRSFEFMIDYLCDRMDGETEMSDDEILKQCFSLAKKFVNQSKNTGDEDRAYHKLAEVYLMAGNRKMYVATLEEAIGNTRQAPMCMLMMAEDCFSRGLYQEAGDYISQCIKMNIETSPNVEKGYPYIMRAVCRIRGIYEKLEACSNTEETFEKELKEIENDYTSAKNVLGEQEERVRNAKQHIDNLKIYLGKSTDDEDYGE